MRPQNCTVLLFTVLFQLTFLCNQCYTISLQNTKQNWPQVANADANQPVGNSQTQVGKRSFLSFLKGIGSAVVNVGKSLFNTVKGVVGGIISPSSPPPEPPPPPPVQLPPPPPPPLPMPSMASMPSMPPMPMMMPVQGMPPISPMQTMPWMSMMPPMPFMFNPCNPFSRSRGCGFNTGITSTPSYPVDPPCCVGCRRKRRKKKKKTNGKSKCGLEDNDEWKKLLKSRKSLCHQNCELNERSLIAPLGRGQILPWLGQNYIPRTPQVIVRNNPIDYYYYDVNYPNGQYGYY